MIQHLIVLVRILLNTLFYVKALDVPVSLFWSLMAARIKGYAWFLLALESTVSFPLILTLRLDRATAV
jgi:hypothetical protein